MKLKFKNQAFQKAATDAVCDVFNGQPFHNPRQYTVDPGKVKQTFEEVGYRNQDVMVLPEALNEQLHQVQGRQHIKPSNLNWRLPELEVEMETGTGKTFVYTQTIFELNKRYGWSKFIIMVPGVAIREGVKKSLEITAEKFYEDYQKTAKVYVYNSSRPQDIMDFSTGADLQILVMNVQAFNATGKDNRRIYMELDEFGSRRPIDLMAANRPILILDEPQKMEGKKTQDALPKFNPLMILRYSATHKTLRNLVYRLDAIDAFEQKLVKKIEPVCIDVSNQSGTHPYLYCAEIRAGETGAEAVVEFQKKTATGAVKTEVRLLRQGDNLYSLSGLEAYQDRYTITELTAKEGYAKLCFGNGLVLTPGQVVSDVSDKSLRRVQIREAIRAHLEKEALLYRRGIKVLTLFFIDHVDKYRVYEANPDGDAGEYARLFEEEYVNMLNQVMYDQGTVLAPEVKEYWGKLEAKRTHAGYFAQDRHHKLKNTNGESAEDVVAYDLILRDKEQLLSFQEPVRFIFSHSALREGWDNPNVFVICHLKKPETGNDVARRQEIGRGLRLCVNQQGDRHDDPQTVHDVNILTVVANESFSAYVDGLQKEIMEACKHRPMKADAAFFTGKVLVIQEPLIENGVTTTKTVKHTITATEATILNKWLNKNDYITDTDELLPAWRAAREENTVVALPESLATLKPFVTEVHKLIDAVSDPSAIKRFAATKRPKNLKPNKNFAKEEFKELWRRINRKSVYKVNFKSEELIKHAIEALNREISIPALRYTVRKGEQTDGGTIVQKQHWADELKEVAADSGIRYDLVGKIAEETTLTRKTVQAILSGMLKARFEQVKNNPEKFISECARIINEQKATMFVEAVEYRVLEETYETDVFTANQVILPEQMAAIRPDGQVLQKHIYDYLISDSKGERKFAAELDTDDNVVLFAKLPKGFSIPTPVGNYNPDWAIVYNREKIRHLYFVAETKGSLSEMQLRGVEKAKIEYAKKHFAALINGDEKCHVTYQKVASYQDLLNVIQTV